MLLSDLLAIHLKTGIGRLSAYCGAVSAGCAAGAGIAYLHGGGLREVAHTLVNSLAIVSGMICDGAKASCAAKISAAVDAGIMGYNMVPLRSAVPRRRRYRDQGRGEHDREHRAHRPPRHARDGQGNHPNHDRAEGLTRSGLKPKKGSNRRESPVQPLFHSRIPSISA